MLIDIEKIALTLPDLPKRPRKNMYDILGIQNKETINSKILAYFLDPNEEHGFGTLFFDSLLEALSASKEDKIELKYYSGEFKVLTEEATIYAKGKDQQQKRIDISIIGEDWQIVIENKLYHHLQNPLNAYWEHAKKYRANVLGVVLSLDKKSSIECTIGDIEFLNITHHAWIDRVQSALILGNVDDDTDLFYLREYIKTIKTHQQEKMEAPQMNVLVQALIDQKEVVREIEEKKAEAIRFIDQQITSVFSERGYSSVRQWYCHPSNENLCFYVIPAKKILEENYIAFGYEVFNELKDALGDTIKEVHSQLKDKIVNPNFYFDDTNNRSNMSRIITYRQHNFLSKEVDLRTELSKILDTYFFNEIGIEDTVLKLIPKTIGLKSAKMSLE